MSVITLKTRAAKIKATLLNTQDAHMITDILPIQSIANTWGNEVYFEIPIETLISRGTVEVEAGDVAFWPEESCLCFFFGPTPLSTTDKPVPASAVILIGKVFEGLDELKNIKDGEEIIVERG